MVIGPASNIFAEIRCIAPLRSQGDTFTDAPRKAKILDHQFSSVSPSSFLY